MFEFLSFELIVHDSVGGWFQGCYLDNHRNNWRCARAVRALCENAPSESRRVLTVPLTVPQPLCLIVPCCPVQPQPFSHENVLCAGVLWSIASLSCAMPVPKDVAPLPQGVGRRSFCFCFISVMGYEGKQCMRAGEAWPSFAMLYFCYGHQGSLQIFGGWIVVNPQQLVLN